MDGTLESSVKHRQELLDKEDGVLSESDGVGVQSSSGALEVSVTLRDPSMLQSLAHLEVRQDGSAVWISPPPHKWFHERTAELAEDDDIRPPMPLVLFSEKPNVLTSATKSPVYRYSGEECFLNVLVVKALLKKVPTRSILNKENYHKDA